MKVELRPEFSTQNPDDVPIMAARGDYMEESLVGKNIHDVLQDITIDSEGYDPQERLEHMHKRLIRRGHFGPYEHIQAYFTVEGISRPCMAQATRHRFISYDVQSMRYANFSESGFKCPPAFTLEEIDGVPVSETVAEHFKRSVELYTELVDNGYEEEDARYVLPLGTKVNMSFSANARTLMHFIDMRAAGDAQWEIIELAEKVLEEAEDWAPITFATYEDYARGSSKKAP